MGLALRAGVSFCDVRGRLVFLDTVADRYFCLGLQAEQAFRWLLAEDAPPSTLPTDLCRTGLLQETDCPTRPRPYMLQHQATGSLLDAPVGPWKPIQLLGALIRLALVRHALQRGGFHRLITSLAADKARLTSNTPSATQALRQIAANFEQTRRLVRSHDQCLPRSITLARQCVAAELPVDLVIGVRLRPFAAHSWVQTGPWLVNDHVDTVRTYTPVLAV